MKRTKRISLALPAILAAALGIFILLPGKATGQLPLKFAARNDHPPYGFMRGTTPQGYTVDLCNILIRILGKKASIELMSWPRCVEELEKGTIDAIIGVPEDNTLKQTMDFSHALCEIEYAIFVDAENRYIDSLKSLEGTVIGVHEQSYILPEFRKLKKIRIVEMSSLLEGLNKLKNHDISAFISEKNGVIFTLNEANITDIRIAAPIREFIFPYSIAVKKGNADLLNEINRGISQMSKTGALQRLNRRWLGAYIVKYFPWQSVFLMTIKITLGLFAILVVLWIVALRTTIRIKTREIQRMSREMIEKEKLTVLGKMAGQIAHELRTPLGVIKNSAYLLRTQDPADRDAFEKRLNMLEEKIKLSTDILESILSYSRVKAEIPTEVSVKDCINDVLINMNIPEGIKVETSEDSVTPAKVYMDFHQLYSVMRNLVLNALQATEEEGRITIETFLTDKDRKVNIRICDTGKGIAESARNKIFNLFYSTKATGTGLGLPISKSIVEANQGELRLEESTEKGTCFIVTLPAAKPAG